MAIDTPATIAIIGAGPIGLEAAIYGRFLGYDVTVFDQGTAGSNVAQWGHVRMFTPFEMNVSPLGLAALHAQDENWRAPVPTDLLTGQELWECYFRPLTQTDLLDGCIREHSRVACVGRDGFFKTQAVGDPDRGERPFRLMVEATDGSREWVAADVVIDASGVRPFVGSLGPGGLPAINETELESRIAYDIPDILGRERARFADLHTLVVGDGYSAATSVVRLAELVASAPQTQITWITRRPGPSPVPRIKRDKLPERAQLARAANTLLSEEANVLRHLDAVEILQIDTIGECRLRVQVCGSTEESLEVDQIIANVGLRPNRDLYRELQVHECFASEGPMKLAACLADHPAGDCLDQTTHGPKSLVTTEPRFYIIGSKSYGRRNDFLLANGMRQIRDVYTIIAGRKKLDLYANLRPLAS